MTLMTNTHIANVSLFFEANHTGLDGEGCGGFKKVAGCKGRLRHQSNCSFLT